MVLAEWFFSTVAQSVAAIAGFIITVEAVLYQLEKRSREKRTDDLREEHIEFKKKYRRVLIDLQAILGTYGPFPGEELDVSQFDLLEETKALIDSLEEQGEYPAYLLTLQLLFNKMAEITMGIDAEPDPKEHYLLSDDDFEELQTSASLARSILYGTDEFDDTTDSDEKLATEIEELHFTDSFYDEIFQEQYDEPVEDAPTLKRTKDWFEEHINTPFRETKYSGRSLRSLSEFLYEMRDDLNLVSAKRHNTILDHSPNITNSIKEIMLLLIVGVFIPLSFLWTIPADIYLTGWGLLFVEISLILTILYLLYTIVNRMINRIEPDSRPSIEPEVEEDQT